MRRNFSVAVVATALTLLLGAGTALAGSGVKNGNFKQGTFKKWKRSTSGNQVWRLYDKNRSFIPPLNGTPLDFFDGIPNARSGYSPVIDQFSNPGTSNLYRKLKLPKKARKLSLYFYYDNFADQFNFGRNWYDNDNQYLSIDVLKKRAAPDTSSSRDIIANLYEPDEGPAVSRSVSPVAMDWTKVSWKVSKKYRGKKVQLRHIVSVFDAPLLSGIDDVKVVKKKRKK